MQRTRYCGDLKIVVRLHNDLTSYTASFPGTDLPKLEGIRRSPHDETTIACDAPRAFDRVAQSAISFLENELETNPGKCTSDTSGCESTEQGDAIIRRRK